MDHKPKPHRPPPQPPPEDDPLPELKRDRKHWFDPEGTMVAQLDSDGLPMGISSGYTRVFAFSPLMGESLKYVISMMWLVIVVMTLYCARDAQTLAVSSEGIASHLWVRLGNALFDVSYAIGPARLREAIDSFLSPLKQKAPSTDDAWSAPDGSEGEPTGSPDEPPPSNLKISDAPLQSKTATAAKARILMVGASSMQFYLGAELERRLEKYESVLIHRFGKLGTGLARPDNFDWPRHLPQLLRSFRPTYVIGQFGGNDGQPLQTSAGDVLEFGTDAWKAEYRQRVQQIIDLVHEAGAKMIMVGMPVTLHKKITQKLEVVNQITKETTLAAGGTYLSTWELAAGANGAARTTITYQGKSGPMFLPDGVHYARVGAAFVAELLSQQLEREMRLPSSDARRTRIEQFTLESFVRNKMTSYLAFVPQDIAAGEKLPVLYLLHGSGGSWKDFSVHAKDLLEEAAAKYRLILVTPDGDEDGWYIDSPLLENAQIATYLTQELIHDVENRLPASTARGIAGISMGGNGAIVLALTNSDLFKTASSMSGTVDLTEATSRQALIERLGPYEQNRTRWHGVSAYQIVEMKPSGARALPMFLSIGKDDKWLKANRSFDDLLTTLGVAHRYEEIDGDHSWTAWRAMLPHHIAWHAEQFANKKNSIRKNSQ